MTGIAIGFAAGLMTWTLLEYAIHYWLGHLPKGRILSSREHLQHHADILYFTPLRIKARGAAPVLAAALVGVGIGSGWGAGVAFSGGIAAGWTAYESLHRYIHVTGPRGRYSRWACRHHLYHHFQQPNANHGVTCPLWDFVFRTFEPVGQVRVPKRQLAKLPWLETALAQPAGDAPHLADYAVV
jgi:dihydroceramide fatty acyl 2-hydroxylase